LKTEVVSASEVDRAVALLREGETVALPTETVYGLAADATSAEAVAKIFAAKQRPSFDPLIVHLPNISWLEKVADMGDERVRLMIENFWPGPLTIVLPRRALVPDIVAAGLPTVAVRMSSHPIFREVVEKFGRPLAAPSANRFGRISPTTAEHVRVELDGRIPLIVDGGTTPIGVESTIIAFDEKTIRLLRSGPISREQLEEFGDVVASANATELLAPGQMKSHYAPETPLELIDDAGKFGPPSSSRCGLLAWNRVPGEHEFSAVEVLSEKGDLVEAATRLFAALRRLDEAGLDLIVVEKVPETGLGLAIMDRLRKAAGHG
jgi:L-threonylcarbamoyladenylate synthase